MGWNWVVNLAQYCQLTVITETGFQSDIERVLPTISFKFPPKFFFIDIGPVARKHFWQQGDWRFYRDYRTWQKKAYELALRLLDQNHYDVVHQLNMIGYREPGYLWRVSAPVLWGPIGGHAQLPWNYFSILDWRSKFYYGLRNILNSIQMRSSPRVRMAFKNATAVISATANDQAAILSLHGRESLVINETGTTIQAYNRDKYTYSELGPLRLVWSGFLKGGKALPIFLRAIARLSDIRKVRVDILGDGPERDRCQSMADQLGISEVCAFHGRVPHADALTIMKNADAFIFTSLLEGTPAVVMEALGFGVPVICHDSCGFGAVVNDECGIKIPVVDPESSVTYFRSAIERIINDRDLLQNLSAGALIRSSSQTWEKKAEQVVRLYQSLSSERNNGY